MREEVNKKNIIVLIVLIGIMVGLLVNAYNKQKEEQFTEYINEGGMQQLTTDIEGSEDVNDVAIEEVEEVEEVQEEEVVEETDNITQVVVKEDPAKEAMEAFYEKVKSQLGQTRDASGNTVYGVWWGERVYNNDFNSAAWCAMFLSWCANEAGISEETVGYFAACSFWQEFYEQKGRWNYRDNGYTPQKGDLIFFDYNADGVSDHNGIVESVSSTDVVAIEGNVDDVVARVSYNISDTQILGYGTPDYANNEANKQKEQEEAKKAEEATAAIAASSSGQAQKLIEVAASQLGIYEDYSGWTKYGQWYQDNVVYTAGFANAHWCAMFVSWCANQAGISSDIIKPYASCAIGESDAAAKGVWHPKSSGYIPKPGDIIFFTNTSHTGIVERYENGVVYTIEGNFDDCVSRASHSIDAPRITGYASPNYQ